MGWPIAAGMEVTLFCPFALPSSGKANLAVATVVISELLASGA